MIITIDTAAGLSESDRNILSAVIGARPIDAVAEAVAVGQAVAAQTEPVEEKPAPRRRAAVKKAAEPVAEEAPIPTAEESLKVIAELYEDDTPAVLEEEPAAADDAPTLEDAVAAATPLISAGKAAVVKAALANAGVKRVGELPAEKIAAFISELGEA